MSPTSPTSPGPEGSRLWRTFKRQMSHIPQATQKTTQTTKLLIMISSMFVLLNIPFGLIKSRSAILYAMGSEDHDLTWLVALKTFHFVFKLNFAINFLLYNWSSNSFRKALVDWCMLRKKNIVSSGSYQKPGITRFAFQVSRDESTGITQM